MFDHLKETGFAADHIATYLYFVNVPHLDSALA